MKKGTGKYFGPYPNAYSAQETKKLLDRIYPFRKCDNMPDKLCLYYHIGQCMGPCVYDVDLDKYAQMTKEITDFLNGEDKTIIHNLESRMTKASEDLDFEQAKEYRDMIQHIHNLTKKQKLCLLIIQLEMSLDITFLRGGCVYKFSSLDKEI